MLNALKEKGDLSMAGKRAAGVGRGTGERGFSAGLGTTTVSY